MNLKTAFLMGQAYNKILRGDEMDREKVIKGIRKCLSHKHCSENGCPYENECAVEHLNDPLLRDALALLKEQEAVEPLFNGRMNYFVCPNCSLLLDEWRDDYCPSCGKQIAWVEYLREKQ